MKKYQNGYKRVCPTHGPMYENSQINKLPQEGAKIILQEIVIYAKKTEDNSRVRYRPMHSHLNSWGEPREYIVVGYTHGEENFLDPKNKIVLEYSNCNQKIRHSIPTRLIATGSIRCLTR